MLRGLLLDLDDTLYDRGVAFAAWADACAGRSLAPQELDVLRAIDRRGHRSRVDFAAEAQLLGLTVNAERFPFELAEHIVREPDVRNTLVELARTRRLAVVTNGGAAQRVKLSKLGLDDVVQGVFVSHEVGCAKPDPAIFERARRWLELPAHEVAFVGDEPNIDLAPAAALGMVTVWRARAPWPHGLPPAAHRIERIGQLVEVCA